MAGLQTGNSFWLCWAPGCYNCRYVNPTLLHVLMFDAKESESHISLVGNRKCFWGIIEPQYLRYSQSFGQALHFMALFNSPPIWKEIFVGVIDIKGFFLVFTTKILGFTNSMVFYVSKWLLPCIAAYLFPSSLNPEILEGLLGSGSLLAFKVYQVVKETFDICESSWYELAYPCSWWSDGFSYLAWNAAIGIWLCWAEASCQGSLLWNGFHVCKVKSTPSRTLFQKPFKKFLEIPMILVALQLERKKINK